MTTTIFIEAQYGYLGDRFAMAYRAAPLPVALWEGTNLVTWLDTNYSSPTKEIIASRVLLHSRLAALFAEANAPEDAAAQGAEALQWFSLIVPDHSFSAQLVVSNTLARDNLKREYATPPK
jgi:hypothetical protein